MAKVASNRFLSELYETVDKLTSCYRMVEPQAVEAVIPQKGTNGLNKIGNNTTSQT